MSGPVIAIDGPAGVGKSTLARRLALALDLPYVNTGTTYRAVASEALRTGVAPTDAGALATLARDIAFAIDREATPPRLLIGGRSPEEALRTSEVEAIVSAVSSHPEVREVLREVQRRLGAGGAVMEGRDIGSVVFPDAALKIFLDASEAERAARRTAERGAHGGAMAEALARRDAADARTSPLVPPPGAIVVDTTGKDADAVLAEVLALARRAVGAPEGSPGDR